MFEFFVEELVIHEVVATDWIPTPLHPALNPNFFVDGLFHDFPGYCP